MFPVRAANRAILPVLWRDPVQGMRGVEHLARGPLEVAPGGTQARVVDAGINLTSSDHDEHRTARVSLSWPLGLQERGRYPECYPVPAMDDADKK